MRKSKNKIRSRNKTRVLNCTLYNGGLYPVQSGILLLGRFLFEQLLVFGQTLFFQVLDRNKPE